MAKTRVYMETTIPSFYHDDRTTPDIVARRQWTREWWDAAHDRHELVTSEAVVDELVQGRSDRVADRLALVADLPRLDVVLEIADIVEAYVRHRLMPADPAAMRCTLPSPRTISATSWRPGTAATWPTRTSSAICAASTRCWGCSCRPWSRRWN